MRIVLGADLYMIVYMILRECNMIYENRLRI